MIKKFSDDFWDYCFPMNISGDRLPNYKNLYETLGQYKKGTPMTSSANDEWNHFELTQGIEALKKQMRKNIALGLDKSVVIENNQCLQHTIDFIEYNMREMEITGGNGDE